MSQHNIKIIVVDGGKRLIEPKKDKTPSVKDGKAYKTLNGIAHPIDTLKQNVTKGMSPTSKFAMSMGVNVATKYVTQMANYYVSTIGRRTGDDNYQSIVNRQVEVASECMSLGTSLLSGTTTGLMMSGGNPVGAIIGATIGTVGTGVSLGFKYRAREESLQHELFRQNNSQAYNLARTSFQGFTGRLR